MYTIVLTRPNIAFTLGYLVRYISDPAVYYRHALKELIRYLKSTINQKLRFGLRGDNNYFVIYTNTD